MPTRTITIHQWGSDDTVWISHDCFIEILHRLRKWSSKNGDLKPHEYVIRNISNGLQTMYNDDINMIYALEKEEYKKFHQLLLDAM